MSKSEIGELERHLSAQTSSAPGGEDFFWHRLRSDFVLETIARHKGDSATVLDIGSGAGIFGLHFGKRFPKGLYAFIEPITALSDRLRQKYGDDADWSGRQSYQGADAVVLLDVLEHQANDSDFLTALQKKLAPGALLIITVPALQLLWSEWDEKLGHHRRYRVSGLRRLALDAGLEVIGARYLFQLMLLPGLLRRHQPPKSTEFPDIPPWLNRLIYELGRWECKLARFAPFGSSATLICRNNG